MTKKTTTVIQKEEDVSDIDSRAVLAFRVGQLEKNQTERFDKLEKKIDDMTSSFVTNDKLQDAQKAADQKHREQDEKIKSLQDWNTWATRLVLGAVGSAIMAMILINRHVI